MARESQRTVLIDRESGIPVGVTSDNRLKVDTEINLSGDVIIEDIKVAELSDLTAKKLRVDTNNELLVAQSISSRFKSQVNIDTTDQVATQLSGDSALIKTALQIIDDWDESDRAKVNVISGQIGIAAGNGQVDTTTPRIVLATDGAVATQLSGDSALIRTALQLLDNSVDGNYLNVNLNIAGTDISANAGQVDSTTLRTVLATNGAVVTQLSGDSALIKTSVQLIDDTIGTIDSAFSGKVNVQGGVAESSVPTEVADADAVALWLDTFGRIITKYTNLSENSANITDISPVQAESGYVVMHDVTLDASPTGETSGVIFVGDKNKLGFIIKTDTTDGGNHPWLEFAYEVSADNSVWVSGDILIDHTGVDSPVSRPIVSGDIDDMYYIPMDMPIQYIRTNIYGRNTGAADTIAADVWMTWKKG